MEVSTIKVPNIGVMSLIERIGTAVFVFFPKRWQKLICHSQRMFKESKTKENVVVVDIECSVFGVTVWRQMFFKNDYGYSRDNIFFDENGDVSELSKKINQCVEAHVETNSRRELVQKIKVVMDEQK